MDTSLLYQNIAAYISLTKEEEEYFTSLLHFKKLSKRQFLLQEGDINKTVNFVTSGILRLYSIDKNGFEHIIQFAPAGWWIGDMQSFLKQKPGNLSIDAIADSRIIQVAAADLGKLYNRIPKFEHFFRILAENAVGAYQQRFAESLSLSAKERYQNFCERYPTLIQALPRKQVASYIGVTPEFLSRMLSRSSAQE